MGTRHKRVRVVLIDPENKTITEQHIEPELPRYYFWIGCDYIESVVREVDERDVNTLKQNSSKYIRLYVDEHGGFTEKPRFIVRTRYGGEELIGKALLIGDPDDDGHVTDCLWQLDDVRKFIFFDLKSMREYVSENRRHRHDNI